MKTLLFLITTCFLGISSIAQDDFDCESVIIGFTYELSWDEITLTSTTTGAPDDAYLGWTVNPSFDDGYGETWTFSTTDYVGEMNFCHLVFSEVEDVICRDSLCIMIDFPEEVDCDLAISYTYEITADEIIFTNTSTGEPLDPFYEWTIGELSSTDENPTFPIDDFELDEEVCLVIYDEFWDCYDSICTVIHFPIVFDCDSMTIDFTYELMWDEITLTSTSVGVPDYASFYWSVNPSFDEGLGETVTFSTTDYVAETEFCLHIFIIDMGEIICHDSVCTIIDFPEEVLDCDVEASFTYEITDDEIIFTNTSTDEPVDPNYYWTISDLSSSDENPSFPTIDFEYPEEVCFVVYDEFWDCYDSICTTITIPLEFGCDSLTVSIDYAIYDDIIHFENTSVIEPDDATYNWSIDHISESFYEHPSFDITDFDDEEEFCFTIISEELGCIDSICVIIGFSDDLFECDIEASFTYEVVGDEITFTNTSAGDDPVWIHWVIDGLISNEENPTFPTTDFEITEDVYFYIYTDTIYPCYDSIWTTISFIEDLVDFVSIDDTETKKIDLETYPNPVSELLNITTTNIASRKEVYLYNSLGELIENKAIAIGQTALTIDMKKHPAGLYILHIIDGSDPTLNFQQKISKE